MNKVHIRVDRFYSDAQATLSHIMLSFDGGVSYRYACDGLEDAYHPTKIKHRTRIPAGEYRVTLRKVGGFYQRYLRRFALFHKGMLWVRGVPGFTYILVHVGNAPKDTSGCLLVGSANKALTRVYNSVKAYKRFYLAVLPAAISGNLTITFEDNDRTPKYSNNLTQQEKQAIEELLS